MLAEERRNRILELLKENRFVSVNELHDGLRVSRETIRRDINRLASENRLIKTHGGAQSVNKEEPAFAERMDANVEAKRAIGRKAAELVPDGATVIIDSGTTCLCTAEALSERLGLTIITNDIHVASTLTGRNDNRVLLLGGEVIAGESATMGHDTTAMLSNYLADFSFIGISSISDNGMLSDYTRAAAEMRGAMIAQAHMPILIGDHDKFGWSARVRIQGIEKVSRVITDRKPDPAIVKSLKLHDIDLVVAHS